MPYPCCGPSASRTFNTIRSSVPWRTSDFCASVFFPLDMTKKYASSVGMSIGGRQSTAVSVGNIFPRLHFSRMDHIYFEKVLDFLFHIIGAARNRDAVIVSANDERA